MTLKAVCKFLVNGFLGKFGKRIVDINWGPCGYFKTLKKIKEIGFLPSQIIDVGAATGQWTYQCLKIFPNSDYFLIDPLTENASVLEKLSQQHKNIKTWIGAVGADLAEKNIYAHGDQSSFFASEYSRNSEISPRCIEMRTLDSFLDDGIICLPDLIKADVQGFELEVLKGADKCLEHCELLLFEVSYRQIYDHSPLVHEVINYIGSKEYRIFDICTYTGRPYDGMLAQSDILFVKQYSKLWGYEGWG